MASSRPRPHVHRSTAWPSSTSCIRKTATVGRRGPASSAPGGYGTITPKGYRRVWVAAERRQRMEHDVVWESVHGPLPAGFQVHHINERKLDNRIENLELLDALTHKRLHSGCVLIDGVWWKPCSSCRTKKPVSDFYRRSDGISSECKPCAIIRVGRDKRRRLARVS